MTLGYESEGPGKLTAPLGSETVLSGGKVTLSLPSRDRQGAVFYRFSTSCFEQICPQQPGLQALVGRMQALVTVIK